MDNTKLLDAIEYQLISLLFLFQLQKKSSDFALPSGHTAVFYHFAR